MSREELAEEWRERLDDFAQSQTSMREWCDFNGVPLHQYYYLETTPRPHRHPASPKRRMDGSQPRRHPTRFQRSRRRYHTHRDDQPMSQPVVQAFAFLVGWASGTGQQPAGWQYQRPRGGSAEGPGPGAFSARATGIGSETVPADCIRAVHGPLFRASPGNGVQRVKSRTPLPGRHGATTAETAVQAIRSGIGLPFSVMEIGRPIGVIKVLPGSIPSSAEIVAKRSGTATGLSTTLAPSASVWP